MKIINCIGCLLFVGLTVNVITKYGKEWDLSGKYHMPTTLLSPDGQTYRDGSEVDPVTLALVNHGIEQEFWLVGIEVVLALVMVVVFQKQRSDRMRKEAVDAFNSELRRIRGMLPRDDERMR
jgi:hypothetical protein